MGRYVFITNREEKRKKRSAIPVYIVTPVNSNAIFALDNEIMMNIINPAPKRCTIWTWSQLGGFWLL